MSPDSANLVMSSGNILPIVVQSQVFVINDQDNGTNDDKNGKLFKTADPSEQLPNLKLSTKTYLYLHVVTHTYLLPSQLFTMKIQKLTRTSWLHTALPDWRMKSHLPQRAVRLIIVSIYCICK